MRPMAQLFKIVCMDTQPYVYSSCIRGGLTRIAMRFCGCLQSELGCSWVLDSKGDPLYLHPALLSHVYF